MGWTFVCVLAFVAALSIARAQNTEFSIKPNGKISHEKASIVRNAYHVTR